MNKRNHNSQRTHTRSTARRRSLRMMLLATRSHSTSPFSSSNQSTIHKICSPPPSRSINNILRSLGRSLHRVIRRESDWLWLTARVLWVRVPRCPKRKPYPNKLPLWPCSCYKINPLNRYHPFNSLPNHPNWPWLRWTTPLNRVWLIRMSVRCSIMCSPWAQRIPIPTPTQLNRKLLCKCI